jgi:hypothetical protein
MSAAFRLLVDCVTSRTPGSEAAAVWEQALPLAERHGVRPAFAAAVEACPSAPAPLRDRMRTWRARHQAEALWLQSGLLEVTQCLTRAGVRAVSFKGPALAHHLHGDMTLRECVDLDLMVPEPQLPAASEALAGLGYRPFGSPDWSAKPELRRLCHEQTFVSDHWPQLEVHWNLLDRGVRSSSRLRSVLFRGTSIVVPGGRVAVHEDDVLLILLCIHGAKHMWARLTWIYDVAVLARRADLDSALRLARRLGVDRTLRVGLVVARGVFGDRCPPLSAWACDEPTANDLASSAIAGLPALDGPSKLRCAWFAAACMGSVRDRIGYFAAPTRAEYERWPLPAALFGAYWVLRPLRLAEKYAAILSHRVLAPGSRSARNARDSAAPGNPASHALGPRCTMVV